MEASGRHRAQAWTGDRGKASNGYDFPTSNRIVPSSSSASTTALRSTAAAARKATERPRTAPSTPNAASRKVLIGGDRSVRTEVGKRTGQSTAILGSGYANHVDSSPVSSSARRRRSAQSRLSFSSKKSQQMTSRELPPRAYTLTRSNSKVSMKIFADKFFPAGHPEFDTRGVDSRTQMASAAGETLALQRALLWAREERDLLVAKLQEDMASLLFHFNEEKQDIKAEFHESEKRFERTLAQAEMDHLEELNSMRDEHEEEVSSILEAHRIETEEEKAGSARTQARLNGEILYLKEAFDSFKASVSGDLEAKWAKKEKAMATYHSEQIDKLNKEAATKLAREKAVLKASLEMDKEDAIAQLTAGNSQRISELEENCQEVVAIEKKLEKCVAEAKALKLENQSMKEMAKSQNEKLRSVEGELRDVKFLLADYNRSFDQKVSLMDQKYQERIHALMKENSLLRQKYIAKCEDYFHLEVERDRLQEIQTRRVEKKMKLLIESQMESFSEVSLATGDSSPFLSSHALDPASGRRPASAPSAQATSDETPKKNSSNALQRPKTCATAKRTKVPDVF